MALFLNGPGLVEDSHSYTSWPLSPPGEPSRTRVASSARARQKLGELASASGRTGLGNRGDPPPASPRGKGGGRLPPAQPAAAQGRGARRGSPARPELASARRGCEADEERGDVNKVATAGGTPPSSVVAEDALAEGLAGISPPPPPSSGALWLSFKAAPASPFLYYLESPNPCWLLWA